MKPVRTARILYVVFVVFLFSTTTFAAEWQTGVEDDIYIDTGKVGIGVDPGTMTGDYKLAVQGTIVAEEIIVDVSVFPDFVFENGYRLPSLEQLETQIKESKHLPGIPSAKEVQANGMPVSEIITKQMQKIEELTLHLISLKKENDALQERVTALESNK